MTATALFLVNLLLLPGVAFIVLLALYISKRNQCSALALAHLRQTIYASIWIGVLLVVINALILFFGGYSEPWVWMVVILYFVTGHSMFVLLGVIALIKSLNNEYWAIPLIGIAWNSGE